MPETFSDLVGKTVSHYQILEKLGAGGMGEVYKARDLKLGRVVALKFLPPSASVETEQKERFFREAQAASALDHPNVCTIHEIDQTAEGRLFISMAYYEGETVAQKLEKGPFPLTEALGIALQTARGLARAHREGVVHLDIKPQNLFLTKEGMVKIVDFGLAGFAEKGGNARKGVLPGTLYYLSPEQVRGELPDRRADIWALGVVLYEMVAGQVPFKGNYEQAVMYSILYERPARLPAGSKSVSAELERIMQKVLAKERQNRFQEMDEMLTGLSSLEEKLAAVSVPQTALAVLPFADLSPQGDQEYFCDGLAEELINALTRLEGLRVASRTSTFQFKGKTLDAREAGEKLQVDALLEGSVRKAGDRLRVTVKLVNVADGYHLWSENYDRQLEDIFAIQEEIARAVVANLKVRLLAEKTEPLVRRYTDNLEAYNLYLMGRFFWNRRTKEGLNQAIEYFQKAIEKDAAYAQAYTGLADSYALLSEYGDLPLSESYPKTRAAVTKALELDNTLAEAQTSLAYITATYEWNWSQTEREFERAIELNPNYATARHWHALFLMEQGRLEEAALEMRRAHELDPLSPVISRDTGLIFYYGRQYDRAIEQAFKTLELEPNFALAHRLLAIAYERKGLYPEAIAENLKWGGLTGDEARTEVGLGHVYAASGQEEKALAVIERFFPNAARRRDLAPGIAFIYTALGEADHVFEWLEIAYQNRSGALTSIKIDPKVDPLRSDSRFTALLTKMGLSG